MRTPTKRAKLAAIATQLGMRRQLLHDWSQEQGFPAPDRAGKFDVERVVRWAKIRQAVSRKSSKNGKADPAQLLIAKTRREFAEAELSEIKRDIARGQLLEVDVVGAAWLNITTTCRQKILGWPSKIISQYSEGLPTKDLQAVLDREVDELLTDLSATPLYEPKENSRTLPKSK